MSYQTQQTDAFEQRSLSARVKDLEDALAAGGIINSSNTVWDDFSVPLTRDKQGQSSKPDYDFDELGLLFPQNDDTEVVNLIFQMKHAKKLDTAIRLHFHYIQEEATQPTFKLDYRWYNNGDDVPTAWTTISTNDNSKGVFSFSSNNILQIAKFPEISISTTESVSSNLDVKFYRDDNDVTGDVLGKYIDFHYQKDAIGSVSEYSKS